MKGKYDVAIVGGGPAGLSASIFLARYLRSVLLVDSGDPRNWETRGINAFLGLPGIKPSELRAKGREEARKYGVELVDDCVYRAQKLDDDHFVITTHSGAAAEMRSSPSRRVLFSCFCSGASAL